MQSDVTNDRAQLIVSSAKVQGRASYRWYAVPLSVRAQITGRSPVRCRPKIASADCSCSHCREHAVLSLSLSLSLSSLDECYSAWPRIGCRPRRRSRRVGDERPIPEHGPDNPVTFRDVSHQSVEAHASQSALSSFADQRTATSCHAVSSVYRIKPRFHVKIKLS